MKKNKIVLGLILMVLIFGLSACKKDPKNQVDPKTGEPVGNVIKVSNDTKAISIFNDMINNIEFNNEVAGTTSNVLTATLIGNGKVEATYNDMGTTQEITIGGVLSGLGVVNNNDDNGYIHVLTEDGHMYYVAVTRNGEAKVLKYEIENVDSFASLYTDLEGKGDSQATLILKTKSGEYYSDYKFSTDSTRVIRKITQG